MRNCILQVTAPSPQTSPVREPDISAPDLSYTDKRPYLRQTITNPCINQVVSYIQKNPDSYCNKRKTNNKPHRNPVSAL